MCALAAPAFAQTEPARFDNSQAGTSAPQLNGQSAAGGAANNADGTNAEAAPADEEPPGDPRFQPHDHPFGPWSLLPPVLAIAVAVITRRIVLSLLLGVLCGAFVLNAPAVDFSAAGFTDYGSWVSTSFASCGEDFLWKALTNAELISIFTFTMFMGAMVAVCHASGGMHGLVQAMSPLAKTRRGGQMTGWGLGLVVFFDDYANTLLLGNTLRPVTDRLKISREKLAYVVDSTAAPIASIALISTWVAVEVEYIQLGFQELSWIEDGATKHLAVNAFVESIPYRFYAIMALVFVAIIAWMGRDFGPMLKAERRAAGGDPVSKKKDGGAPLSADERAAAEQIAQDEAAMHPQAGKPRRWINAVAPILVTVSVTFWLILVTGTKEAPDAKSWIERFRQGDSYTALRYGAAAGLAVAAFAAWAQRVLTWRQIGRASFAGIKIVLPALVILWLAMGIKYVTGAITFSKSVEVQQQADGAFLRVEPAEDAEADAAPDGQSPQPRTIKVSIEQNYNGVAKLTLTQKGDHEEEFATSIGDVRSLDEDLATAEHAAIFGAAYDRESMDRSGGLGTGDYVGDQISGNVNVFWLPTLVFLIAAAVAFATGTSWATMGILTPLVVSVTYRILAGQQEPGFDAAALAGHPVLLACIGGVLAGAIFGDHCSPISDTTILSSVASGCDHIAHVRTQMPYAVVVALLVIPLGTIPAGIGIAWYGAIGCSVLATVAAVGVVYWLGKKPNGEDPSAVTATQQSSGDDGVEFEQMNQDDQA